MEGFEPQPPKWRDKQEAESAKMEGIGAENAKIQGFETEAAKMDGF